MTAGAPFFSAANAATCGLRPGLRVTLVQPSTELVDDALGPVCMAEDLDFGSNNSDGVRLGGGILLVPALLRPLSESENFLARGDGEHAQVFVLRAISWTDRGRCRSYECRPESIGRPGRARRRPPRASGCMWRTAGVRRAWMRTRARSPQGGHPAAPTTHLPNPARRGLPRAKK